MLQLFKGKFLSIYFLFRPHTDILDKDFVDLFTQPLDLFTQLVDERGCCSNYTLGKQSWFVLFFWVYMQGNCTLGLAQAWPGLASLRSKMKIESN